MMMRFIILLLISQVCAKHLLITCNAGCGCMTETGTAVSCPFIRNEETAVLRAKTISRGRFAVFRVVPIESVDEREENDSDVLPDCPKEAGIVAEEKVRTCYLTNSSETSRLGTPSTRTVSRQIKVSVKKKRMSMNCQAGRLPTRSRK